MPLSEEINNSIKINTEYLNKLALLTFSVDTFPNVYLNSEVWFNVGSNFQCINILGIIGDTEWTEGVIEITPLTRLSGEVCTKLIGALLGQ